MVIFISVIAPNQGVTYLNKNQMKYTLRKVKAN